MASSISGRSGPELPIHVVNPYPTKLNTNLFIYSINSASTKYRVTTLDPCASDVLTCEGTSSPVSTAFLARSTASNMTYGLDVFVHVVIAAIANEPVLIVDV